MLPQVFSQVLTTIATGHVEILNNSKLHTSINFWIIAQISSAAKDLDWNGSIQRHLTRANYNDYNLTVDGEISSVLGRFLSEKLQVCKLIRFLAYNDFCQELLHVATLCRVQS